MSTSKECVLAYSGGLDTSAILPWLQQQGWTVHALLVDVGQDEDLLALAQRAKRLGAASARIHDVQPQMLRDVVPLTIALGATWEETYRLGTALARPFIAAAQVRTARQLGCTTLAHGATGKGNDQVRFEFSYRSLAPDLDIVAPWKHWDFEGRADLIAFLESQGFDHPFEENKVLSLDENLWHLSVEGGALEDPDAVLDIPAILDAVRHRFARAQDTPHRARAFEEIRFERGVPVSWNGADVDVAALLEGLNIAYRDADWAWDLVLENRITGVKSRGLYINPAAKLLQLAADGLARHCLNKPTWDLRQRLATSWADLLYRGQFHSPQRRVVEAAGNAVATSLNGVVRLHLSPQPYVGRVEAPQGLFAHDLATFERSSYSHRDADGFIKLSWLGSMGCPETEESAGGFALEADDSTAPVAASAAPLPVV